MIDIQSRISLINGYKSICNLLGTVRRRILGAGIWYIPLHSDTIAGDD